MYILCIPYAVLVTERYRLVSNRCSRCSSLLRIFHKLWAWGTVSKEKKVSMGKHCHYVEFENVPVPDSLLLLHQHSHSDSF